MVFASASDINSGDPIFACEHWLPESQIGSGRGLVWVVRTIIIRAAGGPLWLVFLPPTASAADINEKSSPEWMNYSTNVASRPSVI